MTDAPVAGSARRLRGLALSQVMTIVPVIGLMIWMWLDWWGPGRDAALACLEARGDDPGWIAVNDGLIVVLMMVVGGLLSAVGFTATLVLSPLLIRAKTPRQSLARGAAIGGSILLIQVLFLVVGTLWLHDQSPVSAEEGAAIAGCDHLLDDE